MIKVYIASPYTIGDIAVNVKLQIDTADLLIEKGFAPFVPLYSHFQHLVHPRPYTDWTALDLEWITVCDCLLRIGGESKGADDEIKYAQDIVKIPVFYSINDIIKHYR